MCIRSDLPTFIKKSMVNVLLYGGVHVLKTISGNNYVHVYKLFCTVYTKEIKNKLCEKEPLSLVDVYVARYQDQYW